MNPGNSSPNIPSPSPGLVLAGRLPSGRVAIRVTAELADHAALHIDRAVINIDRMVNTRRTAERARLQAMTTVVGAYVVIALGTVAVLGILSATAPHLATTGAWVHAVIVAVFAVILPLRLRAARAGSVGALRAVGLISAALFLVNVVEVLIPGLFPLWLRVEMIGIAVLMAGVILLVVGERLGDRTSRERP